MIESPTARPDTLNTVVFCLVFSGNDVAVTVIVFCNLLPISRFSLFPHTLQERDCCSGENTVAWLVVFQELNLCPVAGTFCCSVNTLLQTEQ